MVYLDVEKYEEAYKRILEGSAKAIKEGAGACTVLLLVADDPDAICALRILIWLLKQDNIAYKTVPIGNYADLSRVNKETIEKSREIKSIVMINCGGRVDINDYLSLVDDVTVIVIDSHRPYNLYNIFFNEQVIHLDDGDIEEMKDVQEAFEALEFGPDGDSSEDDDDDTGMDAYGDDNKGSTRNRQSNRDTDDVVAGQKRSSSERDDDSEMDNDDENRDLENWDDDANANGGGGGGRERPSRKRRTGVSSADDFIRIQSERAVRRERKNRYLRILEKYYSQATYYGQSSSICAYQLIEQLGRPPTIDSMWWAIVGVSSQFWLDQISRDGYELIVSSMNDTVSRICISSNNTRSASSTSRILYSSKQKSKQKSSIMQQNGFDSGEGDSSVNGGGQEDGQQVSKKMSSSKDVQQVTGVYQSKEFRFTLLRHWSLHSAMIYSPFVVTRLASWTSRGRSRLDLLMAKLGLSLMEIREPFTHLDPKLKRQLEDQFELVGRDFDLSGSMYPSFIRDYGWRKAKVSANDVVQSIAALLSMTGTKSDTISNNGGGEVTPGNAPDQQVVLDEEAERQRWLDGFYEAYDALSQYSTLQKGISYAMKLQQAIIEQGTSILERRAVKTLRTFRLAVITEVDGPHLSLFRHPLTLAQLAQFLMSALREQGSTRHASLPFVIAALNTNTDSYIVLGITPPEYTLKSARSSGQTASTFAGEMRNQFGLIFEETATDMNIQIKQGRFDTSVIELPQSELAGFVDRLRRHL